MSLHFMLRGTTEVVKFKFEFLLSSMYQSNMLLHGSFFGTAIVTHFTFEWLLSFMDWSNMSFQVWVQGRAIFTPFTFEWLCSFMDWSNMSFIYICPFIIFWSILLFMGNWWMQLKCISSAKTSKMIAKFFQHFTQNNPSIISFFMLCFVSVFYCNLSKNTPNFSQLASSFWCKISKFSSSMLK